MRGNGASGTPLFRVTLDQQRLAEALARTLADEDASVYAEDGNWIVSVDGAKSDHLVVRVLDAVRDTLNERPHASALVQLDGREYVMRGDDHIPAQDTTSSLQARA